MLVPPMSRRLLLDRLSKKRVSRTPNWDASGTFGLPWRALVSVRVAVNQVLCRGPTRLRPMKAQVNDMPS